MDRLEYELKQIEVVIENPRGDQRLTIECLRDLDQTIDALFALLEKNGNPDLLEKLCPYFGVIWPSAQALCSALVENAHDLKGKTVLEVGCGLALPSLFSARMGAIVTATDFHPEVPRFLKRNLEINAITGLEFVSWDWSEEKSGDKNREKTSEPRISGTFDWVIGSDILYERQHPAPVARMLVKHCSPGGRILLADPARPYLQAFSDEMRKLGFQEKSRILTAPDQKSPNGLKEIFLLSFTS